MIPWMWFKMRCVNGGSCNVLRTIHQEVRITAATAVGINQYQLVLSASNEPEPTTNKSLWSCLTIFAFKLFFRRYFKQTPTIRIGRNSQAIDLGKTDLKIWLDSIERAKPIAPPIPTLSMRPRLLSPLNHIQRRAPIRICNPPMKSTAAMSRIINPLKARIVAPKNKAPNDLVNCFEFAIDSRLEEIAYQRLKTGQCLCKLQ